MLCYNILQEVYLNHKKIKMLLKQNLKHLVITLSTGVHLTPGPLLGPFMQMPQLARM